MDQCLEEGLAPGKTAEALYSYFVMFGDDPFIVDDPGSPYHGRDFSAWTYAKPRCEELCSRSPEEPSAGG